MFREALERLGAELQNFNAPSKVWVVGGAALVLGYGLDRYTHDIDGILRKGKRSLITEISREISRENNLEEDWFNFEFEKFNDTQTINSSDFLKVETFGALELRYASLELLLATKCSDARGTGFRPEDFKDISFCVRSLGLQSLDDVYSIVESKDILDTTTEAEAFQLEAFLKTLLG